MKDLFDYCIIVKNEGEWKHLEEHLESLYLVGIHDLSMHIIFYEDSSYLIDSLKSKSFNPEVYIIPEYDPKCYEDRPLGSVYCYEHSNTCDWIMSNCGTNSWVILAHPDIVYKTDLLSELSIFMRRDEIGAIGHTTRGVFCVRRKAYFSCDIGFMPLMTVAAFPRNGSDSFNLRSTSDIRNSDIKDHRKQIHLQVDTAELFLVDLVSRHWGYEPLNGEIASMAHHKGHGSNY